ncbi:MAG: hydantoinase/oxoprolinase family protein [Pseudomonadota bacterium]
MFAYGSAGPMLIPQIMNRIGVQKIVVPPNPGLFSALGLASTDLVYNDSKSAYIMLTPEAGTAGQIETVFTEMEEQLAQNLTPEQRGKAEFVRGFDGWYAGQTWETPFVPVPSGHLAAESIGQMISDFHTHYARMWGNSFPFMPVVAITYRTRLLLPTEKLRYKPLARRESGAAVGVKKQLSYLPAKEAQVMEYERVDLCFGDVIQGPAIIREPMSTTMVCLGQMARIGQYGDIQIERRS